MVKQNTCKGLYATFIKSNSFFSELLSQMHGITICDTSSDVVELQLADYCLNFSHFQNEIRLTLPLPGNIHLFIAGIYIGKILRYDKLTSLRLKIERIAVETAGAKSAEMPKGMEQAQLGF